MYKRGKSNSLLIELVIVLLFFSLSASVILQVFVAAHDKIVRSAVDSQATLMAEDIAERFYASGQVPDAFLEADGWSETGEGSYTREAEVDGRLLRMAADTAREDTPAGMLHTITLTVYDGELSVLTLPAARYLPKEGTT